LWNDFYKMALTNFNFENKELAVVFVETIQAAEGVECDVYKFVGDGSRDLGIIRVKAGHRTPLQRVLKGERTIEGYISGKGNLEVVGRGGEKKAYTGKKELAVEVKIGETMQWQAAPDSDLEVYEICFPPYENGRFENLSY